MSKQMASTTSRFTREFLLVELALSTIPDWLTTDVLVQRIKVLPHIRGQHPLPLGSATGIGASGARHRAPSDGRGSHWSGSVSCWVAIGLSGDVFVTGNEATVTKIIVDGSRTDHEMCRVRCAGVEESTRGVVKELRRVRHPVCRVWCRGADEGHGVGAEAGAPSGAPGAAGHSRVVARRCAE
jgi:hypothetical protein